MRVSIIDIEMIDIVMSHEEVEWLRNFIRKPIEINRFSNESDEDTTIRIELYKQLNKLKRG